MIKRQPREEFSMRHLKYYLPGSLMILSAVLILVAPEVLVILASSLIIMSGIGVLYLGHLFRKMNAEFKSYEKTFFNNVFTGFR